MAEKRMFSRAITFSDRFLDLPDPEKVLYYSLGMCADDDGFLGNAKSISRMVGISPSCLESLERKGFVFIFPSGVVVIRHWLVNNLIRKERHTPTVYQDEMAMLTVCADRTYALIPEGGAGGEKALDCPAPICHPTVTQPAAQNRIGENKKEYTRSGEGNGCRAVPDRPMQDQGKPDAPAAPSLEEVIAFSLERNGTVDPHLFFDYYAARGWRIGDTPVQNWKAAFRSWEKRERIRPGGAGRNTRTVSAQQYEQREYRPEDSQSIDDMLAMLERNMRGSETDKNTS